MRQLLLAVIAAAALTFVGSGLAAPEACAHGKCPGYRCTSSSMCIMCACAIREGETLGYCR